jgi:hypothetical protein
MTLHSIRIYGVHRDKFDITLPGLNKTDNVRIT